MSGVLSAIAAVAVVVLIMLAIVIAFLLWLACDGRDDHGDIRFWTGD